MDLRILGNRIGIDKMDSATLYSLRTVNLLSIPQNVQDIISAMQLAPVSQIFNKKYVNHKKQGGSENWRNAAFAAIKATILKKDDSDYELVVGITNKASNATVSASASAISEILKRRENDDLFRLRVVNLLFSRGVGMPFFSKMMANIFELVHVSIPQIKDDLVASCSIDIFNTMFDMSSTVVFPDSSDPTYEDKICEWNKKREIRRGFGMFATELHLRGLVDEETIQSAIHSSIGDMDEYIRLPSSKILIECVDQIVTLLFEVTNVLLPRFGKGHSICKVIATKAKEVCSIPKTETPCLGMRSKFKLDDITKL